MLAQGCLRGESGPFLGNNLFPLEWVYDGFFVNGLKWVQEWVKSGFLGAKVGQNASKPTFAPTLTPFRHTHENPLFAQFKGGRNCYAKSPSERVPGDKFISLP